tara:strand:+ start:1616 stop:2320 length:705 start_codon:yes stop_codon:yes gene_type:complete
MKTLFRSSTILLILPALFTVTSLKAQTARLDQVEVTNPTGTQIYTTNDVKEIVGTPYYNDDWEPGIVTLINGTQSKTTLLSFNTYTGEVFYKERDEIKVLNKSKMKGFTFTKKNETFALGVVSPDFDITADMPIRVIHDGKTKLYIKYQTTRRRGNSKDPLTGITTDRFSNLETTILKRGDGKFVKTKIKKKNIINDLGDHKAELEAFTKKTRNKVKSGTDVALLLEYYDTLLD